MSATSSNETSNLRKTLRAYVPQAKENERKLGRLHEFEIRLISASGLHELLNTVIQGYQDSAMLQSVGLLLIDENYEIRHLLDESGNCEEDFPGLHLVSNQAILSHTDENTKVWMGQFDKKIHSIYFPNPSEKT